MIESVHRALTLAREFQQDVLEFGISFVTLSDLPEPGPEDASEAARQFGLDYHFKLLNEADARLRQTERELLRVGVDLSLYTDLHRAGGDTVTFFDIIADELCGQGVREPIAEASDKADIFDLVFRVGVMVRGFEEQAAAYLRKRHRWRGRTPEAVVLGAPREVSESFESGYRPRNSSGAEDPPPNASRP
ncbi:hypothetical protein ACWEV3_18095 [Saccharopolyspora sp. NPDC003752]